MAQNPPPSETAWLIAGLGNPGTKYESTRHNIGFMALEALARKHGLSFSGKQAQAQIARGRIGNVPVVLAKPVTYMNNSGQAVQGLARFYKIPPERVLIVYDDFDLPLGRLRIRGKGSAGTHNGMKSIIQHLGTQDFPRLRIGVDRPIGADQSHISWVLGRFSKDEQKALQETLPRVCDAIEDIVSGGMERAMNLYNTSPEKESA